MRIFGSPLLVLSLAAGCGASAGGVAAPPAPVPVGDLGVQPANLEAQLTPYVEAIGEGWGEAHRFNGFVLVAQHDQPIYAHAFGLADRAASRAPTADTTFRVGSVTKQFTAAAILQLEVAGKLSVQDPVSKLLPEYPAPGKDVTVHQLLTHTSGIPNFTADPAVLARKNERWTTQALLESFWNWPLEFAPGTRFAYSNAGYVVLGAIIERVTGKTWAAYVHDALFVPAGMTRTAVDDAIGAPDLALGYQLHGDALVPADPIDLSLPFAAGAVRSTASDLVKWHRALSGDVILPAAARARLYVADQNHYGYGWVMQPVAGHPTVWHNGGIDGFSTIYWRVPDADLVVVAWSNTSEVSPDAIGKTAVEAAFGAPITAPVTPRPGVLDPAVVARAVGSYALTENSRQSLVAAGAPPEVVTSVATIEITASESGLVAKPVGQTEFAVVPLEGGSFYNAVNDVKLAFELPAIGPATGVVLTQGGLVLTYQRQSP